MNQSSKALYQTIQKWQKDLGLYDFDIISKQTSVTMWSLGQVYMHLIESTSFFIEQALLCTATNQDQDKAMSKNGQTMFRENAFPDIKIEGPASNELTAQPTSIEFLIENLEILKVQTLEISKILNQSHYVGKMKHPGLGFFNADEWIRFADMHFRHHERQKNSILQAMNIPIH